MTDSAAGTSSRTDLLHRMPEPLQVSAGQVRAAREAGARTLVVLDDDPTGTQSVANLPVLTTWTPEDLTWALGTGAPAVYVMTNSRSLDPGPAAERNRQVARSALHAAARLGLDIGFVSRGDSTLRGHYPLEPDVLIQAQSETGLGVDGVLVVPAFGDAGRLTVGSVHYAGSEATGYVPVGQSEFADDASFGYSSSDLREWVQEKTAGRIAAEDVVALTLEVLRSGPQAVTEVLTGLADGRTVVVDIVEEADLRVLALGILAAEAAGRRFVHRVGPPFVRALIGQDVLDPLTPADVATIRGGGQGGSAPHGLVVVGSHVAQTTRQLQALRTRRAPVEIEIEVSRVLDGSRDDHLADVVSRAVAALTEGNVVVTTSRQRTTGADADSSLDIARNVSDAVVEVVQQILAATPLRFVVAKGGITSSDVASRGLGITRAMVRGPMLPGIVSLWEPTDGPARGIPFIVFAGNVGDDRGLADVVDALTS